MTDSNSKIVRRRWGGRWVGLSVWCLVERGEVTQRGVDAWALGRSWRRSRLDRGAVLRTIYPR